MPARFDQALEENPAPRWLGDVRLRSEPGRLIGESLPPRLALRLLPAASLTGAVGCALGAAAWLLAGEQGGLPVPALLLSGVCGGLVVGALWLEARLGRRRFVLHFSPRVLRLERLAWSPWGTRAQSVPFAQVQEVQVVERVPGGYALVVVWQEEGQPPQRAVLVERVGVREEEALLRVWRLLNNAFGLKGAGLAGG
jgi:hypothetical protein